MNWDPINAKMATGLSLKAACEDLGLNYATARVDRARRKKRSAAVDKQLTIAEAANNVNIIGKAEEEAVQFVEKKYNGGPDLLPLENRMEDLEDHIQSLDSLVADLQTDLEDAVNMLAVLTAEPEPVATRADQVVRFVNDHPGLTPTEISKESGIPRTTVQEVLPKVAVRRHGRWYVENLHQALWPSTEFQPDPEWLQTAEKARKEIFSGGGQLV